MFETIKYGFHKGHTTTVILLDAEKAFGQVWLNGFKDKLTTVGLNRKLLRWISNFLYQKKLIIPINNQLSDPITFIHSVSSGIPLSPIPFVLHISDILQLVDAQVNHL